MSSELQILQLENEQLRESNAWYRARNIELLRLLSGRAAVVENPEARLQKPHARATLELGETETPPPVTAYVRHGHAHL